MEQEIKPIDYRPIAELKIGQSINQVFLVKECNSFKWSEKEYTVIRVKDRTGEIAVYSDGVTQYQQGTFLKILGEVKPLRKHPGELMISSDERRITKVSAPNSLENYIFALDDLTKDKLKQELFSNIDSITDTFYADLVKGVLVPTAGSGSGFDVYSAPLTDEGYGNYSGALLEHIVYSLRHVNSVQLNYIDRNSVINLDLIKAIIMLHDVGRIYAFQNIMAVEKTWTAKLIGVPTLTLKVVFEKAPKRNTSEESMKFAKVIHGIDVCNFVDKTPLFTEALIAQQIQKLDALVSVYSKTLNSAKPTQLFTWENPVIKTELFNG